jgi:hypothetical protein
VPEVFSGKVRKTGFFQKAGFPGNADKNFGIYYNGYVWVSFQLVIRASIDTIAL